MSYWNHRLVKDVESGRLAIHEVYYNDDGTPTGYTENPVFIDTFFKPISLLNVKTFLLKKSINFLKK